MCAGARVEAANDLRHLDAARPVTKWQGVNANMDPLVDQFLAGVR